MMRLPSTQARQLHDAGTETVACTVDVSDRASVDHSLDEVRRVLGPVEIMVTSAAIAAFVPFTEITLGAVGPDAGRRSHRHVPLPPGRDTGHAFRRLGTDRDDRVVRGTDRLDPAGALRGGQGRGDHVDEDRRPRVRQPRYHREHHPAVLRRHPDAPRRAGRGRRPVPRGCRGGRSPRAASGRATTSPPRALSSARRARATSPARSSASMAGRCCERHVGSNAPASVPFRRASDGSRDRVSVAGARA